MTLSKTQCWLAMAAIALALPVVATAWWMLSSEDSALISANEPDAVNLEKTEARSTMETGAGDMAETMKEAGQFRAYAETLRAQGQPEKTVRELVASRIAAAFEVRRAVIRTRSRRADANAADIEAQLGALKREQGALITWIVGEEEHPDADAAPATAAGDGSVGGDEKQALMPAVMAAALPASVKTEEQAADWEHLRHDFTDAIGRAEQNPAGTAYRHRWIQAQTEADQRFRLLFGDTAFVQHQMQAQQEAALNAQKLSR